jgi:hypothetical protein
VAKKPKEYEASFGEIPTNELIQIMHKGRVYKNGGSET